MYQLIMECFCFTHRYCGKIVIFQLWGKCRSGGGKDFTLNPKFGILEISDILVLVGQLLVYPNCRRVPRLFVNTIPLFRPWLRKIYWMSFTNFLLSNKNKIIIINRLFVMTVWKRTTVTFSMFLLSQKKIMFF